MVVVMVVMVMVMVMVMVVVVMVMVVKRQTADGGGDGGRQAKTEILRTLPSAQFEVCLRQPPSDCAPLSDRAPIVRLDLGDQRVHLGE